MKRPVTLATLMLSLGLIVPGCPIYNEDGCQEDAHCAPGYLCEEATGDCVEPAPACERPSDCSAGATCDREGRCRSVDCSWEDVGCVSGYSCVRDDGVWRCVAGSSGGNAGTGGDGAGGVPAAGGEPAVGGSGTVAGAGGQPGAGGAAGGAAGESSSGGVPATGGSPSEGGVPSAGSGQGGA
jgi:hypothetical protein